MSELAPTRGDAVEAWIKGWRDEYEPNGELYNVLDDLLEDYRLHADTGEHLRSSDL